MGTTADELKYSDPPGRICGQDELYAVDVYPRSDGKNAMAVDAQVSVLPGYHISCWDKRFKYLDMNASNGGVARGTTILNSAWTTIFSYTGKGYVASLLINLETFTDWQIRLIIDGEDILIGPDGILSDDVVSDVVYDLDDTPDNNNNSNIGISKGSHDRFIFAPSLHFPIRFTSSVSVQVKRVAGKASKKFSAGLIALSREA